MRQFAGAFAGTIVGDGDVPIPSRLPREQLRGSIDSLKAVDDYLSYVSKTRKKITEQEWSNLVHWGGAYVGEVIRGASKRSLKWMTREAYLAKYPDMKKALPESLGTKAILVGPDGSFTLPLNKVMRFMEEGDIHSMSFYVHGEVEELGGGRRE